MERPGRIGAAVSTADRPDARARAWTALEIELTCAGPSVGGFVGAVLDPAWFIAEQIPQSEPIAVHANSQLVALQLGNLYLLMAFMGLAILNTTSENRVVRGYLVALWLGDIGHVAISCWGLGWDKLMSPNEWNAMAGGNIFFTVSVLRPLSMTSKDPRALGQSCASRRVSHV